MISPEGGQLGIKTIQEALRIAEEHGLDLVEVAPQGNPPVCRIMDYGKYRYEIEQKQKRARKHQTLTVVKEIKMRPKIEEHDYEVKKRHAIKFLEHRAKVKVTMMFRGREITHADIGEGILQRLIEDVKDYGMVESAPKKDGRNIIMVLAPVPVKATTRATSE